MRCARPDCLPRRQLQTGPLGPHETPASCVLARVSPTCTRRTRQARPAHPRTDSTRIEPPPKSYRSRAHNATHASLQKSTPTTSSERHKLTDTLAHRAGELAQAHGLRGYDAVHLAAASAVADSDVVLVTGDSNLANAANSIGIAVCITKA
jgi:predicted nucleic acid-binding protein